MDRIILHSDCNSFYASVELLHHPELRDKPVSVGGDVEDRHGIILSSNPLAKSCGVKTGEAIWQATQKCRGLVVVPPNYELYSRFSGMTRQIYLEYTDLVEPFGLDEAWLDVTHTGGISSGVALADELRERMKLELGITVSIGVSYNKIFAKLGSDYKKPDATTEISRENYRQIAFPLPVGDLLYVGRATERKLRELGVYTIGDLADFPKELLKSRFGKWGEVLHSFANGTDCSVVDSYGGQPMVKSVGNSTTAPRDLENPEDVKIISLVLADSVSRRLREQGLRGRVVSISVRSSRLFWYSRQKKLDHFTNLSSEIFRAAIRLFEESYRWEDTIRSLGISVSDLSCEREARQLSVFEDSAGVDRREKLEETMDGIKNRFGTYAVQPAVLLKDKYLAGFDPKQCHNIHPVGYFKEAVKL